MVDAWVEEGEVKVIRSASILDILFKIEEINLLT